MELIDPVACGKAFLHMLTENYGPSDTPIQPEHRVVAEYLFEKLLKAKDECQLLEENENDVDTEYAMEADDQVSEKEDDDVPLEYKQKFMKVYEKKKSTWKFETFQKHFRLLRYRQYILRWQNHVQQGGTRSEILTAIDQHTYQRFEEERTSLNIIHDCDLQSFAIQKSLQYPAFPFQAGKTWLHKFKRRHRIVSRKIVKLVKKSNLRNEEEIRQSAIKFREEVKNEVEIYNPKNVWNTDQTGFQYEIVAKRTLSFKGERKTLGSADSPKNKATHSYTAQYIISMEGKIVGDCFVCLQEVNGCIGPIVENAILPAPNLIVTSSKSGKLTSTHVKHFVEKAVSPYASKAGPILYLLDNWKGQNSASLYEEFQSDEVKIHPKFIPESTTDICQPLDTYFHLQLKLLVRKFYSHSRIHDSLYYNELNSRNGILRIQSLVHFILSSSKFHGMIKNCWFTSGLLDEQPEFQNVNSVCFSFCEKSCVTEQCINIPFIKCS